MVAKEITSLQHPFVKECVKLREDRKFRHEQKKVLIYGDKIVLELAEKIPLATLIATQDASFPHVQRAKQMIMVTRDILKKIAGVAQPESLAAIVDMPAPARLEGKKKILILDGISDPGNLGTLLRTALSFGWDALLITPYCTDPFNEKALRAAKGATFLLPLIYASKEEWAAQVKTHKIPTFVADRKGKNIRECTFSESYALVLGNESHGSTSFLASYPSISVPMTGPMESLNVAVAGGILMFAMMQGERHA